MVNIILCLSQSRHRFQTHVQKLVPLITAYLSRQSLKSPNLATPHTNTCIHSLKPNPHDHPRDPGPTGSLRRPANQKDADGPRSAGTVLWSKSAGPEANPEKDQEEPRALPGALCHGKLRRHVPGRPLADETQITKAQLEEWVSQAYWSYLSEYTVPWVAAESPHGWELGLKWIESDIETTAAAGWGTLAYYAAVRDDEELDIKTYTQLLEKVGNEIHDAQNRVRYAMNGFVISIGSYVPALTEKAKEIGEQIGKVHVDVGGTACKVPLATQYIQKVVDMGRVGVKRKTARC